MIALQSKRLIIRQSAPQDAKSLAHFFKMNQEFHNRLDKPNSYYTPAYWKRQIVYEDAMFKKDKGVRFYLFLKGHSDAPVGMAVFDNVIRGIFQSCTLGYLLGEDYQGKGLMTEGLETAIQFVFGRMNLHRISAAHVPTNKRSCAVLTGLGFETVGLEPKYLRINGKWLDHELHTLINDNWKAKKRA